MTNQSQHSNMATGYEILQRQRMEYVSVMHQWGLGLISVAAIVLSAFMLLADGRYLQIGLVIVFFILYLWRHIAHYLDDRVKELYYDIVSLEEKLGFNWYLKRRAFFNELGYFGKFPGKMSDFIHNYYHVRMINIFGDRGHFKIDALVVLIGIFVLLLLAPTLGDPPIALGDPPIALWQKVLAAIFTILLLGLLGKKSFEKNTLGYCFSNEVSFWKNFKVYFRLFLARKRREFPQRMKAISEE